MTTTLEQFKILPYDEKLKISMNIVTNLKDKGNTQAQNIFDYISKLPKIPENILESIYSDFETSVERIKKERVQDDIHKFSKAEERINELKKREAQERAQENPDGILEQI